MSSGIPAARPLALSRILRRIVRRAAGRCAVCGQVLDSPESPGLAADRLCLRCRQELAPRLFDYCPRCGRLHPTNGERPALCVACRINPPPWAHLAFHGAYEGQLRHLILRYKFSADLGLGALLEQWMAEAADRLSGLPLDLIAPVPLHRGRLLSRGYNQSLELARRAASALGLPLSHEALTRTRATRQQYRLSAQDRRENIRGAFAANRALVEGRAVLLTDDILTTGATLEEATRALLRAGAMRVEVLVLARRWRQAETDEDES